MLLACRACNAALYNPKLCEGTARQACVKKIARLELIANNIFVASQYGTRVGDLPPACRYKEALMLIPLTVCQPLTKWWYNIAR